MPDNQPETVDGLTLLNSPPQVMDDEILLIACIRNENLRLPRFLEHYRRLGVRRFLIIDNASDDGSTEFLRTQPDVHLFYTRESYAQSKCGVVWQNTLLARYAVGHWSLVVDADELFIYPDYETLCLERLAAYLDETGAQAMRAPLLDMYSPRPIARTGYQRGESFLEACPCFDADTYGDPAAQRNGINRGGPRERLFWSGHDRPYPSPVLAKVPFLKWREDLALDKSTHNIAGIKPAQARGVLLHFKFLQDFAERARLETERKEHFAEARQYAAYWDVFAKDPVLTAHFEGSHHYRDSAQLVDLGLMVRPAGYPAT